MSSTFDLDGDGRRKALVEDGMPSRWSRGLTPSLPVTPFRSESDAERDVLELRRRAERLAHVLQVIEREDPPTIPEGEPGVLMAFLVSIEDRIGRAANSTGCHAYARREPGRPISCSRCARPIDRAAEACFA